VADNDFTSADPWGLPVETEQENVEMVESHPAPEPTVDDQAAGSVEPAAGDEELEDQAPDVGSAEPLDEETPHLDEPTAFSQDEPTAFSQEDAAPEIDESFVDDTAADDTQLEDEPSDEVAPAQPVSQAHTAARNVLDALGVGLDDLPEEPPAWMEEPAETVATPPSVYQELASLSTDASTEPMADLEDVEESTDLEDTTENVIEDTTIEEEPTDLHDTTENAAIEEEPPAIEEAAEQALSSIADDTYQGIVAEPADLEDAIEQAVSTIEPEQPADLEDAIQQAASAISEPGPTEEEAVVSAVSWGSEWQDAAQGWVQQEGGRSTWRPIVTTTQEAGAWEIDTFLGLAAGDALLADVEHGVPAARSRAVRSMVEEALARGAHAVVGVKVEIQEIGGFIHVGATGTAVTLKSPT